MKIEKLNENQLRATLTREDLMRRQIRLSEFAYGTDAARALFNELLRFASYKLGFEVDDTPFMVEATPLSSDSLVILVTKTPYPEELDTRFASFSDAPNDEEYLSYSDDDYVISPYNKVLSEYLMKATDILDVDASVKDAKASEGEADGSVGEDGISNDDTRFIRQFVMESIDDVFAAARIVGPIYHGDNTLYRTRRGYELVAYMGDHSPQEFNRVVNMLSEFGSLMNYADGTKNYFNEHSKKLVKHYALQSLMQV